MDIRTAVRQGAELLEQGGKPAARLNAEVLLCHALHCERPFLYAHPEQELREVEWIHYGRYLHERLQNKPTQYITGTQEFYGRPFRVTPDVLIPRPETEHLIEVALPVARVARVIIDVGTGSGAIAITLALEAGRGVLAVDFSAPALAIARGNAAELGAPVEFVEADALSAIGPRQADLIVSNPPYVDERERAFLQPEVRDWEPPEALFAAEGGYAFYRGLIPAAAGALRVGGTLILEVGAGQAERVAALFGPEWSRPLVTPDLAGIARVISGTLRGSRRHW